MKFPATNLTSNLNKKGMTVTLYIDEKDTKKVVQHLHNFIDKPLSIDINIDAKEQLEKTNQISNDQRKKIYAIFNDFAEWIGDSQDSVKKQMKIEFCNRSKYDLFSLSNCSKDLAIDFITFLIDFAFKNGIDLQDHPKTYFDDIEKYVYLCWQNKICVICGKPADKAHYDTIGIGNNRKTLDDSDHRAYTLCREHHTEEHKIGKKSFCNKYHIKPIKIKYLNS